MVDRVTLVGRLTRDPEVHETAGGKLTNLRIVTTEYRKGEDGQRTDSVQYHPVIAFGRLAEIRADYLAKGRLVFIEGKLRTREWEGRDSLHRYTTEVVADTCRCSARALPARTARSALSRLVRPSRHSQSGARRTEQPPGHPT